MKTNKSFYVCFMVIIIMITSSLTLSAKNGPDKPPKGKGGPPPALVKVSPVKKKMIRNSMTLVGSVISPRSSIISSEVEGLLNKVYVSEGDRVRTGAKLTTSTNSQINILVDEARSNALEAANRLLERKTNLEKLENDYALNKKMFEEKIINEHVLTNSRLAVNAAREKIFQAESVVESKKTKIKLYLDRLKKLTVYAPYSGVITKKFVDKGEWIKTGHQLMKIVQTNPIWIEVPVPEKIISQIIPGINARVYLDAIQGQTFIAKIFKIIPEANIGGRTFPVRLLIKNPKGLLKLGMTARVELPFGEKKEALMIPRDAITVKSDSKIVFTVGEDNTAKLILVNIGVTSMGWVEVSGAGLSEKDLVVTRGGERLRPGQTVSYTK